MEEVERLEHEELSKLLDDLVKEFEGRVDVYELARLVDEVRKER